ncbi:hypothetical protein DFA_08876 [Cavenderia fasciculata]|uniref:Uncharacterized protein n=1 Tax=Cavenderia fasciculata TaxID=261658 RepID=F4Q4S9_CACFS|nr:uncharacterized protein DFA_08876 [Cavenderia fasciculata]EGG17875.1 hypothetical protein DFA_08876 [Cavenderia fasciculata]|eukprot:XP_004356359.1 hypothetical protein DFA_08876 [Cavenderia fasciculata]
MAWIGWFMCFGIIVLVPIDIVCTNYRECIQANPTDSSLCENEPLSYVNEAVVYYFYKTFYFGTLFLTWLVYPFLGSFVLTGDFKLTERIQRAIRENVYLYLIFAVIGLIILIWLLAVKQLDWNSMVGYAMAAANTWGLFLVIVLMGYGLVETPRTIWNHSNRVLVLRHLQFKVSSLVDTKRKTSDELFATLKQVKKVQDKTKKYDPYEKHVEAILEQCPPEYSSIIHGEGTGEITYSALVSLNQRLKAAVTNHRRSEFLYEQCINEAFEIEDIMNSYGNVDKIIPWSYKEPRTGRFASQLNYLEWTWYNYLEVPMMWILAIWFVIMSVVIIWSEISVSITSTDVSILSNIVKHSDVNNIGIQFILFFPLGYEALTTYSTLFKIRIFNYYRLIPHQHSDSNSIIFSAAYLCRLAAPLCYNFTTFIHYKTTFTAVMGNMDYTPFLGKYFYVYFPMIIIIVCLATLFNVFSRIMNCLNMQRFKFDSEFSHENIDEGKVLIESERRKRNNSRKVAEIEQQTKNSWVQTSGKNRYSLLRNQMDDEEDYDMERGNALNNSVDIYNSGGYNGNGNASPPLNNNLRTTGGGGGGGKSLFSSFTSPNTNTTGSSPSTSSTSSVLSPSPNTNNDRLKTSFNSGFPSMDRIFGNDKGKGKDNNNNNNKFPSRK